jgi:precorrin-2 dehydrogenase/sirohydrochlorin ferrochelatase
MTYPISLKIENKKCVVIGGGRIAARKIKRLIEADAIVTVISPAITNSIESFVNQKKISFQKKSYEASDIIDASLIIAATNDDKINMQIYRDKKDSQWINIVDAPQYSDFFVPATIQRGMLTIAVSTNGASPGLAKRIKKEIADQYDDSYKQYVTFLNECRQQVKELVNDPSLRAEILSALLHPDFLELTKQCKYKQRQEMYIRLLQQIKGK